MLYDFYCIIRRRSDGELYEIACGPEPLHVRSAVKHTYGTWNPRINNFDTAEARALGEAIQKECFLVIRR